MRNLLEPAVDQYRIRTAEAFAIFKGSFGNEFAGAFLVPSPIDGKMLKVLATIDGEPGDSMEWEHLSVSRQNRIPNWTEMDSMKHLFFLPEEVCFQIHPPVSEHVNIHNNCLHIWRPVSGSIYMPPKRFV